MTEDPECRSEARAEVAPGSWTVVALLLTAAVAAWVGRYVILHAPDAARFGEDIKPALPLWAGLIGGLCGYGLAAGIVMARWSWNVLRFFRPPIRPASASRWALATALILSIVTAATGGVPAGTVAGRPVHLYFRQIVGINVAAGNSSSLSTRVRPSPKSSSCCMGSSARHSWRCSTTQPRWQSTFNASAYSLSSRRFPAQLRLKL